MTNLIIYYSRKGAVFGKSLAVHGAEAAQSEKAVSIYAFQECSDM